MKKFLIKLSYTVLPIWLIMVGCVFYISLYVEPHAAGDMNRLTLNPHGRDYLDNLNKGIIEDTLFNTINSTASISSIKVDVLTIGDSFSQQENLGYQNFLCLKGLRVANCWRDLYSNPLQYAYYLLKNNILDSTNCKTLVVQTVERSFWDYIESFDENMNNNSYEKCPTIENEWSVARARDMILYRLNIVSPIYTAKLDRNYFNSVSPDELMFYHDDVEKKLTLTSFEKEEVSKVIELLHDKAKSEGINLIYMMAVDKYDLYQDHILNNTFPKKTINEDVETIFKDCPYILFSKQYLKPHVDKGAQDIFMWNDSHWSHKAALIIANELYRRIMESNTNATHHV